MKQSDLEYKILRRCFTQGYDRLTFPAKVGCHILKETYTDCCAVYVDKKGVETEVFITPSIMFKFRSALLQEEYMDCHGWAGEIASQVRYGRKRPLPSCNGGIDWCHENTSGYYD